MQETNLDIHNGDHQISDATDGQELVELKTISQSVVKKAYNVSLKQPCVLQKNCNPAASEKTDSTDSKQDSINVFS